MMVEGQGLNAWQPLKINVRNLIRDFLDMYPTEPEEVVLTESIANSLDAGAKTIRIGLSQKGRSEHEQNEPPRVLYSIEDDGAGMTKDSFENSYHGIALSTKEKGGSIGFAGVGAKLYLAMLGSGHSVYTETRSKSFYGASEFTMVEDQAVWRNVEPRGCLRGETGTFVELELRGGLTPSRAEEVIRENYGAIIEGLYGGTSIYVSWRSEKLRPQIIPLSDYGARSFTVGGRKKCTAYFWMADEEWDRPRGLDIVVLGKKVRSGEWFNLQFETKPEYSRRVAGMIRADPLASLLTTNKQDIRAGNDKLWQEFRSKAYFAFRRWLRSVGAIQSLSKVRQSDVVLTTQVARTVNELLTLPSFEAYDPWSSDPWTRDSWSSSSSQGAAEGRPHGEGGSSHTRDSGGRKVLSSMGESIRTSEDGREGAFHAHAATPKETGRVQVRLVHRPQNAEEAWMDAQGVVINSGHPVFRRSQKNGRIAETNHMMRCVFMALMENRDPSKKGILDELRKFYQGWAAVA